MKKEYILFIDSGTGGLSTLCEVYKRISANFIYFADNQHCPYGSHTKKEIFNFLKSIIDNVLKKYHVKLVVLACNTATTSSILQLRRVYPDLKFIGTEPAIKLAADLGYKRILMISTPVTATQKKYRSLKSTLSSKVVSLKLPSFATDIELWLSEMAKSDEYSLSKLLSDKPVSAAGSKACSLSAANMAEASFARHCGCESCFFHAKFYRANVAGPALRMKLLQDLLTIRNKSRRSDCIVLGCTHYALIAGIIRDFSRKPLISGNFGVAKEISRHFSQKNNTHEHPTIKFMFSNPSVELEQIYKKIFIQILANPQILC